MSVIKPGSDWDLHGCIISAGYSWCDLLGKCIRVWEQSCEIPYNCLTFSDGCNMCQVENGQLSLCTEMMCFQKGDPYCAVYQPDMVIDPLPPLVNPFLDNGH